MMRAKLKPLHVIAVLTPMGLVATSCGITEDEPAPPAETAELPGQQLDDDAPAATEAPDDANASEESEEEPEQEVHLSQQGVSAGNEAAAEVGEQILEQGGNAVDAAVAAAFAVSVIEPVSSGVGGGGSVIVAGPSGEPVFYDYREVVNTAGDIPDLGTGIPGFVAGMGQLHGDYGELDWEQVIAPAISMADEGVTVAPYLAERISTGNGPQYLSDVEAFNPGGEPLAEGDALVQPDLAQTLQRLSDEGWEDYYTGQLADSVAGQVGGIDQESLADYDVITTEPVSGTLGDYQVVSAAPALPGAALIQMLQIAEAEGIAGMDAGSAEYVDTLARAWGVAEDTIRTDLGDPNFVDVPVEEITDPESNAQIEAGGAADAPQAAPVIPEASSDPNTTHISVVDEAGLTVSMTNTLTDFWGAGQEVDGYFVNNALERFSTIESSANQPEPGRRSVTWSNPTMVLDDQDRPVMAIGSPGGIQLLSALGIVISQWALQDADLQQAVESARFRGEDNLLYVEEGQLTQIQSELGDLGWQMEPWPVSSFGSVQALVIDYDADTVIGADDPRRAGAHRIID